MQSNSTNEQCSGRLSREQLACWSRARYLRFTRELKPHDINGIIHS